MGVGVVECWMGTSASDGDGDAGELDSHSRYLLMRSLDRSETLTCRVWGGRRDSHYRGCR